MFKALGIFVVSIVGLSIMFGGAPEVKNVDQNGQCAMTGGLKMRAMLREQEMVSNVEEVQDRVTPIYHGESMKNSRVKEGQVLVMSIMSFDHAIEGHRMAYTSGVFNATDCSLVEAKVDAIK